MKKIPAWIYVIIVLVLLIFSKQLFFPKKNPDASKGPGGKGPAAVAVNYIVTAGTAFSNDVFAAGKVGAMNQVEIVPEVSGRVVTINFKEGESVNKGELLVKLNDADLQAQLVKNKTQVKLAEQKLERLKQLIKINGISQEEFDMQDNELQSLKADQAYLLAQIAKTSIVAPFSGQAGLKNISEGSFVNTSSPVVSLVQTKPLYIEFSVPEKYGDLLKKGTPVKFSNEETDSSETHEAKVYAIEPAVDEATRTIRARAAYNGPHTFFPGSFVKVFVDLGRTEHAIMVPSQAVVATLKGQKVYVAHAGTAVEVPVQVGVRTDKAIQVTEGLQPGDTVLTTGLLGLRKDSKIKLINSKH